MLFKNIILLFSRLIVVLVLRYTSIIFSSLNMHKLVYYPLKNVKNILQSTNKIEFQR